MPDDAVLPGAPLAMVNTVARPEKRPTLIVFGRLPVPGQCKTRLIPALGPRGSANLYARLLKRILREALAARLGDVVLMLTPAPQQIRDDATLAPLLVQLEDMISQLEHAQRPVKSGTSPRVRLEAQPLGGLGERMQLAMARYLPLGPVLLMGSDIPALGCKTLQDAARALQQDDAVLLPTEDGGYGLIGLKAPCPQAFSLSRWSHAQVSSQTLSALARTGLGTHCLPTSWDVDEPEDLDRLTRHYPELINAITH